MARRLVQMQNVSYSMTGLAIARVAQTLLGVSPPFPCNRPSHALKGGGGNVHWARCYAQTVPAAEPKFNIANDATQLVGRTPMVFLSKICDHFGVKASIAGKMESMQPLSKDRDSNPRRSKGSYVSPKACHEEVCSASEHYSEGVQKTTLVEPTSGNMGIGLAFLAASLGYRLILTMPSYTSLERRVVLRSLGAELVLTDPTKGMGGAVAKAQEIVARIPNSHMLNQFENSNNTKVHYETTGPEIWEDTAGKVDIFVAGIGSGGTVSGVGKFLKRNNPEVTVYGVEPLESNILNGGKPGPHQITGTGVGFVPGILDVPMLDGVVEVASEEAIETSSLLATKEGILAGISAGANTTAALKLAKKPENEGKLIAIRTTFRFTFGRLRLIFIREPTGVPVCTTAAKTKFPEVTAQNDTSGSQSKKNLPKES